MSVELTAWAGIAATLFVAVLRSTTPLLFAALGGLVSELAGCLNVALEGLMLVAAFFAVIAAWLASQWWPGLPPWGCAWIGCGFGLVAAMACAGLLAVFHLEWGADLVVAGIAINILAEGLTIFTMEAMVGDKGSTAAINTPAMPSLRFPGLGGHPVLDTLLNGEGGQGHNVLMHAAILCAIALPLVLTRTRFGLHLRAVGENERAALGAGIAVKRVRYQALLLSGAFAGLGGIYLSLGYLTLFQSGMSGSRGFLALAAVFLGARRPLGTIAAALLFGVSAVLATQMGRIGMPIHLVYMLPPLVTLGTLMLVGAMRRQRLLKIR